MGMSLHAILKELSSDHNFQLDYDRSLFRKTIVPGKFFKDEPLDNVLNVLFDDYEVYFHLSRNNILVIRDKEIKIEEETNPVSFNFSLTGKIADSNSGETLPFATIVIKSTGKGTISNVDGFFTLLDVPSDTSALIVQYMGYYTREYHLSPSDLNGEFKIELDPEVTNLEEITVLGQKEHMIKASDQISKISVSPKQLSVLPSIGEKDIFRSLQMLPGISATNETSAGLYVRGGTPDQNLVLFDGFTVYHVDHFYGFFSAFNANAVKDVQLYKGGFGSNYGGRLSSVVDLTGKTGNINGFSMTGGVSALSANVAIESPLGDKGSFIFTARRSYTDIIKSSLYNNIFDLYNNGDESDQPIAGRGRAGSSRFGSQTAVEPAFFFHDLNAKFSYRPSGKDIVSFSVYNGKDNLDESSDFEGQGFGPANATIDNSSTDLTQWGNWGSSLKWGHQWNERLYSNTVLAYSNYFSDRDLYSTTQVTRSDSTFTLNTGTVEDNDLNDLTLRTDLEYLLNPDHTISFGLQSTLNKIDYNLTLNDTLRVLNRKDRGISNALYIQNRWTPNDKLTITGGLRGTYFDVTGKNYLEPRLSASYMLTDRLKLKGAWGKYYQFVNRVVREDLTEGSRDFWLLADDESVKVGSSLHYIAGISYEINDFLFDVELYRKEMTGLSEYSFRFANPRQGYDELFYDGSGYSRGVELLAQKKFGKYTGWLGYTLSEVIHEFPGISETPYPALHDQTHEFKSVNSWRLGDWSLSATWVFATGKPYTAPLGGYELTYIDGNTQSYVSVGEKNSFRLPDYHRMDVSFTRTMDLGNGKGDVGLSIFNLYGRSNVWYRTFDIIEDEVVSTDVQTIGFTPNLFFNFKF